MRRVALLLAVAALAVAWILGGFGGGHTGAARRSPTRPDAAHDRARDATAPMRQPEPALPSAPPGMVVVCTREGEPIAGATITALTGSMRRASPPQTVTDARGLAAELSVPWETVLVRARGYASRRIEVGRHCPADES